MFFARFLFFSLAMLFSYLQADELRKRPSCNDNNHTIKTHIVVTPKNNISRLVGLKLADKEKKLVSDNLTNLDANNYSHDDLFNKKEPKPSGFVISSPHFDSLKKIAADCKEKMRPLKNMITGDDHDLMLLPIGVDDRVEKEASNVNDDLAIQVHASITIPMSGGSGGSSCGSSSSSSSSSRSGTSSTTTTGAGSRTTTITGVGGVTSTYDDSYLEDSIYDDDDDDDDDSSDDDYETPEDIARRVAEVEKIKSEVALREAHGYVFTPSIKASEAFKKAEEEVNEVKTPFVAASILGVLGIIFPPIGFAAAVIYGGTAVVTYSKVSVQTKAYNDVQKEKKAWEIQSLKEIENKIAQEAIRVQKEEIDNKAKIERVNILKDAAEKTDRIEKAERAEREQKEEALRVEQNNRKVAKEAQRLERAHILKEERIKIRDEKEERREIILACKEEIKKIRKTEYEENIQKNEPSIAAGKFVDPIIKGIYSFFGYRQSLQNKLKDPIENSRLYSKSQNPHGPHNNLSPNGAGHGNNPKKDKDDGNNRSGCSPVKDVMINGKKYREHALVDKVTQCLIGGYGIPYDGSDQGYIFTNHQPIFLQNTGSAEFEKNFATWRQECKVQSINRAIQSGDAARAHNIACDFERGKITREEAIELEQLIVLEKLVRENEARFKEEKKAEKKEKEIKDAIACRLADRQRRESAGAVKEKEASGQRAAELSRAKLVIDDKSSSQANIKKAQVIIKNAENRAINDAHVDLLPVGAGFYQATLTKNLVLPRNEMGAFVDNQKNNVNWDSSQNKWKVTDAKGQYIRHFNSLPTATKTEQKIEEPVTPVGGGKKPEPQNVSDWRDNLLFETPDDDEDVDIQQTDVQKIRKQLMSEQDAWVKSRDLSNVSKDEELMIHSMLNAIVDAQNDTTIELAQAGLQAWTKAQQAQSDEERAYYIKKSKALHDAVEHKTPIQSIPEQAKPINVGELDNLLQDYTTAVRTYHEEKDFDRQRTNTTHFDRLEKRAQALIESKEQVRTNSLVPRTYEVSSQARGFMMANNMNHAAFDGAQVTNFQHCLTQEILGIIESSATTAQNYDSKSIIGQLATYNCNLAVAAQQLNQLARVEQAVAVVDLNHFFNAYAKLLVDSGLHSKTTMDVSLGAIDGTARALQKWGNFLKDLGEQPHQTLGKITNDLQAIGTNLYKIAGRAAEFTPAAYLDDMQHDMLDNLARIKNRDGDVPDQDQLGRMMQRTERNAQYLQDGLCGAVQTAQLVVDDMLQKSLRQNVAGVTEIGVDTFITGKVSDCLMKLAEIVGTPIVRIGEKLADTIPANLQDSKPIFMASPTTGELFAIADTTGESIGAAVAAKKLADNAENLIKRTAQAKELTDKIYEITKTDKAKKEVTQFNKELAEVTNATEVRSVDRLKEISKDIPQVEEFRKYTNDFKNLEKLKPEEVLYLNLCDFVEPKAVKINARLKDCGGLKFIDPVTQAEIVIEKYDLVHSLVCEMKPEAFANRTSGGHLYIPELRAATLEIGKIESFGHGFFDMGIRPIDSIKDFKLNSYFPVGTSVEQAVEMIEKAITNPKLIEVVDNIKNNALKGFKFTNQEDQVFMLLIKNKTVQFYPYKPRL